MEKLFEALRAIWGGLRSLLTLLWLGIRAILRGIEYIAAQIFHWFQGFFTTPKYLYIAIMGTLFAILGGGVIYQTISLMYGSRGDQKREDIAKITAIREDSIYPQRGKIYDVKGRIIALDNTHYRLYMDFNHDAIKGYHDPSAKDHALVTDILKRDIDSLAHSVARVLRASGKRVDPKQIRTSLFDNLKKRNRETLVVNQDISLLELEQIRAGYPMADKIIDSVKNKSKQSLMNMMHYTKMRSHRYLPYGMLARRTIGDTKRDASDGLTHGNIGIEQGQNEMLRGSKGLKKVSIQSSARHGAIVVKEAQDGYNVHTTLDMQLQHLLESVIIEQLTLLNARRGSAILMEVATGEIRAICNQEWSSSAQRYVDTKNYALTDQIAPGSTIKTASMMVALEDGIVQPTDSIDTGNGSILVGGRTISDGGRIRGKISVSQIIERSSNVGIAKVVLKGYSKSPQDFVDKMNALGFGLKWESDIPGQGHAKINSIRKGESSDMQIAWPAHGYSTEIPPLHMLAFYNAIANNGTYVRPHVVKYIKDQEGNIIHDYSKPEVLIPRICSEKTLHQIQDMLRKVVLNGTGRAVRSNIVSVSGKSGTAQYEGRRAGEEKRHHVVFCGYFPSEQPKYSIIVDIHEPASKDPGGGAMSGPVVREIAERIYSLESERPLDSLVRHTHTPQEPSISIGRKSEVAQALASRGLSLKSDSSAKTTSYVNVSPTYTASLRPTSGQGVMPNFVGMGATDAYSLAQTLGYSISLSGHGRVRSQSPSAGSKAGLGTKLVLELSH